MTYDKLGYAEAPLTGVGFNELLYVKANIAVMPRTGSGAMVSPTQRFGKVESARECSGWAQRIQSTYLEFNAAGEQDVVVRFTGPCSRPYVSDVTTGKEFFVRAELLAGEEMIVDMAERRVTLNNQMVFGYTGRWFQVKPGDLIRAGAAGIGEGFSATIEVATVGGLLTKQVAGHGDSVHSVLGRPQVNVARTGIGASEHAGRGGRQGVGAGKLVATVGGDAEKDRGY